MLPAPMVIVLGPLPARDSGRNDSGTATAAATTFLLSVALAAMSLATDI
jgi:hypothetical protein